MSTDQVILGAARIGNVAIAAGVKQGKLSVDVGNAQIYSGSLAATRTAEMRGDTLVSGIEARMADVPAGVALADIMGVKSIDGTGTATIKLDGSGASWGAFAHNLAGTAKISLADGTLAGLDVARIAAILGEETASSAAGDGGTAFSAAVCNLKIAGGAVTTDDLRAEGDNFRIDLAAAASLFDPSVSGRGTLTLGKADAARALPFELSGTWQEPELFPDLGRIIKRSEMVPAPRG
jgi:AsmA protein